MDKLSELIKEARPLYRRKKRQKAFAGMVLGVCVPVLIISSGYEIYSMGDEIYVSLLNNSLQKQLLTDEIGFLGQK